MALVSALNCVACFVTALAFWLGTRQECLLYLTGCAVGFCLRGLLGPTLRAIASED